MIFAMRQIFLIFFLFFITNVILANPSNIKYPHIILQTGGFNISQGSNQMIGIEGLVGDRFTLTSHNDQNVLLGIGCLVDGINKDKINVLFGINAFYFSRTIVQGNVRQEDLFTNLSYRYSIINSPVYLMGKLLIPIKDQQNFIIDFGVGPNFIQAKDFSEKSLDGITIPDHAFTNQMTATPSVTGGIGFRFNHVLGQLPLEVSYRFFYLGTGYLKKENSFMSDLSTGNSYANALIISTST